MPESVRQFAKRNPRSISHGGTGNISAFENVYGGKSHEHLIQALDQEIERRWLSSELLYNRSLAIIQSSGMGKSRLVEEVGDHRFTIRITLSDAPEGRTVYPPPDRAVSGYFVKHMVKSDQEQQLAYGAFLLALARVTYKYVNEEFADQVGKNLPLSWNTWMKEGRTGTYEGRNRKSFFDAVVASATKIYDRNKDQPGITRDLDTKLRYHFYRLAKYLYPDLRNRNALGVSIMEVGNTFTRTLYSNLGRVLLCLIHQSVFFIFLSTHSGLQNFASPSVCVASELDIQRAGLLAPYIRLPLDVFLPTVLEPLEALCLDMARTTGFIVAYGRPLWYTFHRANPTSNILQFALSKLIVPGSAENLLAACCIRIGIIFKTKSIPGFSKESILAEKHMRNIEWISQDWKFISTGYPSEPVLAEAAALYLNDAELGHKFSIIGPLTVASACEDGSIACGERGELCICTLATVAHDAVVEDFFATRLTPLSKVQPKYHYPIPLLALFRALFQDQYYHEVLRATPFETASKSHLSYKMPLLIHYTLAEALIRGAAIRTKGNQGSVDAVIPIHLGGTSDAISIKTTSAINIQVQNRSQPKESHVDRSATVPDPSKPTISLIFEFGATNPGIQINHKMESDPQKFGDHTHYEIVVYSCGPEMFRPITKDMQGCYRSILGSGGIEKGILTKDDSEARSSSRTAAFDFKEDDAYAHLSRLLGKN
ncbi:hypothetical protein RhiJN_26773 [Ceratobasidium sp. AG-Ba]|nr:hypothetical protein RhiJN_26773 [Ceratobasidium sp. AG-Ba]